jgi:zinc transporter ZupT
VGAGVGVVYTHGIHIYAGLEDLEAPPATEVAPPADVAVTASVAGVGVGGPGAASARGASGVASAAGVSGASISVPAASPRVALGYRVLLQNALHSAAEGIAVGMATVLELRLGIFLALALAVHNIAESMALTEILRRQGATVAEAAGLCVVAKITTPVLALAAFALAPVMTALLPGALGFAAGCLVFLVLTELLPASYRRAAKLPVGVMVSAAAGAMVLLEHLFMQAAG